MTSGLFDQNFVERRKLSPKARFRLAKDVLADMLVEGLPYREMAKELQESTSTVWRWSRRPEVLELAKQARARRSRLLSPALRYRYIREAHGLAWRVATGELKIRTRAQAQMLSMLMGLDEPLLRSDGPYFT